jgi:hypothetical protein
MSRFRAVASLDALDLEGNGGPTAVGIAGAPSYQHEHDQRSPQDRAREQREQAYHQERREHQGVSIGISHRRIIGPGLLAFKGDRVRASLGHITRVKVDLPKQLPSRLTTLQKACTNAQFEANPAGCPAASKIGMATVTTPLLPVPLTGPAIFVSHGGEAFPDLIVVLQGDGVTIDLVGTTFISKAGITSTTFKTVPDAPVISFELTLPQGPFSALAANGNPCTDKLVIPIEILAQNGAKINERTPISVSGCAKKKTPTRAQKLNAALKVCRKKPKSKHAGCEKLARKAYGPVKKSKQKARGVGSSK